MDFKKTYILSLDQISIFSEYLNIDYNLIVYSIKNNKLIINSNREDTNPSLCFKYYNDKLVCRDFGDYRYRGDVFEIAGFIINRNCNNKLDFNLICEDIIKRMNNSYRLSKLICKRQDAINESILLKSNCDITPMFKPLNNNDFRYFNQFGINKKVVLSNYRSVYYYYINEFKSPFRSKVINPCYSFIVNPNKIKLYFPFASKTENRFITNNKLPVERFDTITPKDYLILIKSYKDKLLFDTIIKDESITNVQCLSLSSESVRLQKDIVKVLRDYNNKDILVCLDCDKAGYLASEYYEDVHRFSRFIPTEPYKIKDITDMCKAYGYVKTKEIIINKLNKQCHLY